MNINIEKTAPYAPFGCVITVIKRFREKGLPDMLTTQEITRIGVSEGNASRTLQALRFLNLVDEEGHRTLIFNRLGRVPTSEYAEVFSEILKEAYSDVFTIVDPAGATDIEINDAFRHYQPHAQRGRMVTLFMSLCREVGLVAGGPPKARRRTRMTMVGRPYSTPHSGNLRKTQDEPLFVPPNIDTLKESCKRVETDYTLLQELLQHLPLNRKWTQERHDRWIQAFIANIDYLIDIEIEEHKE